MFNAEEIVLEVLLESQRVVEPLVESTRWRRITARTRDARKALEDALEVGAQGFGVNFAFLANPSNHFFVGLEEGHDHVRGREFRMCSLAGKRGA
jgi:hypothetical protein